jgi:hypothetical protein
MTPCARSHAVPGEHTPPCTCTRECPEHTGHCTGCLPVMEDRGLLCARCADQLEGFLGAQEGLGEEGREVHGLPWAYDHLEHAYPSLSQAPGGGGSSIEDAEAERLANVVSLRADIHDVLAAWTDAVADGLAGPDLTLGITATPATILEKARRIRTRRRAAWLLAHADALHAHPAVAEAWQELADLMSRAHALAPWRPAPTKLEGIPCRCGALALHDYGTEVQCAACRWNFSRETYGIWVKVLGRRYDDESEGQRAVKRTRLRRSSKGYGGRADAADPVEHHLPNPLHPPACLGCRYEDEPSLVDFQ